ncbi:MAG: hypothetical protein ACYTHK_01165 [Planctomycetota bacterium]|jgi:hypothetical protein
MSYTVTRALRLAAIIWVLAALAGDGLGKPGSSDDTDPRAPGKPLTIKLKPWYCPACYEKELVEGDARDVNLMQMSAETLAGHARAERRWHAIESPNFRIFSTLKGAKISYRGSRYAKADFQRLKEIFPDFKPGGQGSYVDAHQRAHLYHIRLERIYAHFMALTGNGKRWLGMKGRFQIYLLENRKQFKAVVENVFGKAVAKDQSVAIRHIKGKEGFLAFATCEKMFQGGDPGLHVPVAHNVAQMLVNGNNGYYTDVWAWLEEGMAHYYARRESVLYNHFCLADCEPPPEFVRGNWKKKVRHTVYRKKDSSFGNWCETLTPHEFSGIEHAMSWSIVDWLMEKEPIRLAKLLEEAADYKKNPTAADAIKEVFGISPYVLHDRWRKHVLDTYKR